MMENKNIWIWILAVVALLFFFGSFGMSGYGMGMMGFGFIFMLIFWGIIILIPLLIVFGSLFAQADLVFEMQRFNFVLINVAERYENSAVPEAMNSLSEAFAEYRDKLVREMYQMFPD